MNKVIFPDDVMGIIKHFFDNANDETKEYLILAIGAELLDVSIDTMLTFIKDKE